MKVMVIVKASTASEAGEMPSHELLAAMGAYNEELVKAEAAVRLVRPLWSLLQPLAWLARNRQGLPRPS